MHDTECYLDGSFFHHSDEIFEPGWWTSFYWHYACLGSLTYYQFDTMDNDPYVGIVDSIQNVGERFIYGLQLSTQELENPISPCQYVMGVDEFLDSNYIWIEARNNGSITSTKYTIDSQPSLISSKQYFQVLKTDSEFSTDWSGTGEYIRYENNIVYTPWLDGEEEVINFNLTIGDTFSVIPPGYGVKLIVDKIDTITLLNGEQRRRWKLRCIDDNPPNIFGYTEWIEGIGNIDGLFATDNMCIFDVPSSEILCMYKNDNLIYDNPDYDSCWVTTTSTDEVSIQTMRLIPNPASDILTITTSNESLNLVRIYNVLGNLIFGGRSKSIDISKFPEGFYILTAYFENSI